MIQCDNCTHKGVCKYEALHRDYVERVEKMLRPETVTLDSLKIGCTKVGYTTQTRSKSYSVTDFRDNNSEEQGEYYGKR